MVAFANSSFGSGFGGNNTAYGARRPQMPRWGGFDRFDFNSLPTTVWNKGQINQLANQSSNTIARGVTDTIQQTKDMLAGTGARGALSERVQQLNADAAAQDAAARTDATLRANSENAQYGLQRGQLGIQQEQMGREYDVQRRLQDLQERLGNRGYDVTERGQDIEQQLGQLQAMLTGRGQDIGWQSAVLGADTERRGQDVTQRWNDLQYQLGQMGIESEWDRAQLAAELQRRGQDLGYATDNASLSLQERIAQMQHLLAGRGQDIDWQTALLNSNTQNRGLDVTQRGDELGFLANLFGTMGTMRGQDVTQRGDELQYLLGNRGIDQRDNQLSLEAMLSGRGQDIDAWRGGLSALAQALGISSGERGQDLGYAGQVYNTQNDDYWQNLSQLFSMLQLFGSGSGQTGL